MVVPPKTPPVVVPPVVTLPAPTTGVMILTWVDPTENVNDTALTNLAGVKIYYDDTQTITIGLGQLIYEFTDVPIGNHCVSMTAFNTLGAESAHSPTVCEDVE